MNVLGGLHGWLRVAGEPAVLRQAFVTALVVGTILMVVNHGDDLFSGRTDLGVALEIGLTYLVPFLVSVVSSATAVRRHDTRNDRKAPSR